MKIIISIEGSESNTETNIFTELMLIAQTLSSEVEWVNQEFIIFPIALRKCGDGEILINVFEAHLRREGISIDDVDLISIVHDEDNPAAQEAQECSIKLFAETYKHIAISKIEYSLEYGNKLNNIEGELIAKIIPERIVARNDFKKVFGIKAKSMKENSFKNLLSECYRMSKTNINIYSGEGLLSFLDALKTNESAYYQIIVDVLTKTHLK